MFKFDNCDYVVAFIKKTKEDKIDQIDAQDKLHVRIMANLQMAKEGFIEKIMNSKFKEKFYFDKEKQTIYYVIKIIRERKVKKKYADC